LQEVTNGNSNQGTGTSNNNNNNQQGGGEFMYYWLPTYISPSNDATHRWCLMMYIVFIGCRLNAFSTPQAPSTITTIPVSG